MFFVEKFVLGVMQQSLIRELFTTPEANKSQLLELPEPEHGYGKATVISSDKHSNTYKSLMIANVKFGERHDPH